MHLSQSPYYLFLLFFRRFLARMYTCKYNFRKPVSNGKIMIKLTNIKYRRINYCLVSSCRLKLAFCDKYKLYVIHSAEYFMLFHMYLKYHSRFWLKLQVTISCFRINASASSVDRSLYDQHLLSYSCFIIRIADL